MGGARPSPGTLSLQSWAHHCTRELTLSSTLPCFGYVCSHICFPSINTPTHGPILWPAPTPYSYLSPAMPHPTASTTRIGPSSGPRFSPDPPTAAGTPSPRPTATAGFYPSRGPSPPLDPPLPRTLPSPAVDGLAGRDGTRRPHQRSVAPASPAHPSPSGSAPELHLPRHDPSGSSGVRAHTSIHAHTHTRTYTHAHTYTHTHTHKLPHPGCACRRISCKTCQVAVE